MVLGVLTLVLLAVAVALSGLVHQLSILGTGPILPIVVIYVGVGVVVAQRRERFSGAGSLPCRWASASGS